MSLTERCIVSEVSSARVRGELLIHVRVILFLYNNVDPLHSLLMRCSPEIHNVPVCKTEG